MFEDKQKQIEEMAKVYCINKYSCNKDCTVQKTEVCDIYETCESLYNAGYRKIPENVVVLTEKEYKRYERIEKIIKLAKMEKANGYEVKNGKLYYFSNMLDGCEIEFKDLQEICDMANHYLEDFYGLDQRLVFWKGKAETIGEETAEKFAKRLKAKLTDIIPFEDYEVADWNYDGMDIENSIDEICKEITEGKE